MSGKNGWPAGGSFAPAVRASGRRGRRGGGGRRRRFRRGGRSRRGRRRRRTRNGRRHGSGRDLPGRLATNEKPDGEAEKEDQPERDEYVRQAEALAIPEHATEATTPRRRAHARQRTARVRPGPAVRPRPNQPFGWGTRCAAQGAIGKTSLREIAVL